MTSPLAIVLLFALLIYSHTAIPTAYQALGHFFSEQRPPAATNGHHLQQATNGHSRDILTSELASPLVSDRVEINLRVSANSIHKKVRVCSSLMNTNGFWKITERMKWGKGCVMVVYLFIHLFINVSNQSFEFQLTKLVYLTILGSILPPIVQTKGQRYPGTPHPPTTILT